MPSFPASPIRWLLLHEDLQRRHNTEQATVSPRLISRLHRCFPYAVKSARSNVLHTTDEKHKRNYKDGSESFIWIKRGYNLLTRGLHLHILWRHAYSMELINNHYPRVTSFSLLGTPIALAESLSYTVPPTEIFTISVFVRTESNANYADLILNTGRILSKWLAEQRQSSVLCEIQNRFFLLCGC